MDKQQQNIAIAKACGWQWNGNSQFSRFTWIGQGAHPDMDVPPEYTRDLNAIHQAIIQLINTPILKHRFFECLVAIQEANEDGSNRRGYNICWETTNATAEQRAKALLYTLGLWEQ